MIYLFTYLLTDRNKDHLGSPEEHEPGGSNNLIRLKLKKKKLT